MKNVIIDELGEDDEPVLIVMQGRLVEGQVYTQGQVFDNKSVEHDRLVFLLAKEWLYPVGGWEALPDDLFLDVMEIRD
jgi:hypothetical protein